MRTPNNYLHNPFQNRFNDPVSQRHDDMQAYAYMVWLRERNQMSQVNSSSARPAMIAKPARITDNRASQSTDSAPSSRIGRIFAGIFSVLLLLVSVVVLMKAF